MITFEQLHQIFDYDGTHLVWKQSGRNRRVGSIAGCTNTLGYRVIRICGALELEHRLVWLWHYGIYPEKNLDHANGDRSDNRLDNLRECSQAQNLQNRARPKKNRKHQWQGCDFHKTMNKWRVRIRANGAIHLIGYYTDPEEAQAAYFEAKERLHTFHPDPVLR